MRRVDARPNNKLVLRLVITQNRGLLLNFMKFRGTSPIADRSSAAISASDKFPLKVCKVRKLKNLSDGALVLWNKSKVPFCLYFNRELSKRIAFSGLYLSRLLVC